MRAGTGGVLAPFDVGSHSAPAVADLDLDGDPDFVVGRLDGTFTWLENDGAVGTPSFVERIGTANPLDGVDLGSYASPVLADLDGDGDQDLVAGDSGVTLRYFENVGTAMGPVFVERSGAANPFDSLTVGTAPRAALGDLDGDGDLDLVVGTTYSGALYFENDGDRLTPNFVERTGLANPLPAVTAFDARPALADADGDGDLDLLVGDVYGSFSWWRNDGSRTVASFSALVGQANPMDGLAAAYSAVPSFVDLDGDGDEDVVSGRTDGTLASFENLLGETVAVVGPAVFVPLPFSNLDIASFGDLDVDGDLDAVVGAYDPSMGSTSLLVATNTGSPTAPVFSSPVAAPGLAATSVVGHDLGDLDGDGDLDVAFTPDHSSLVVADNVGTASAPAFSVLTGLDDPFGGSVVVNAVKLEAGDLDGDSDLDVLVGKAPGQIDYFESVAGSFVSKVGPENPFDFIDLTPTPLIPAIDAADTDGDGDLDLLLSGVSFSLFATETYYYENIGTAAQPEFVERSSTGHPFDYSAGGPGTFALGDLDGDGDPDAHHLESGLMLENAVVRPTPRAIELTAGASPLFGLSAYYHARVGLGDIDGDGDVDLVSGQTDGTLRTYENVGTATAPAFVERTGGANPFDDVDAGSFSAPTLGDLDADGDLDAMVGHSTGAFRYYENVGTRLAPAFVERTGTANPIDGYITYARSTPSIVDLDADGDLDIVAGGYGGRLWYFQNTGSPTSPNFQQVSSISSPFYYLSSGYEGAPTFGDIDRDGDFDLVVGQPYGAFWTFENVGTATTPSFVQLVGTDDPFDGQSPVSLPIPALGDLYGDGWLELVSGASDGDFHVYKLPEPRGPLLWASALALLRSLARRRLRSKRSNVARKDASIACGRSSP